MEVYVLSYNDSGVYGVYANKEDARNELWRNYAKEVLPSIEFNRAKEFIDEDIKTLMENDYILDYGYIESAVFYDNKPKEEEKEYTWVLDPISYDYVCGKCEKHSEYATPYCPYCGAKMWRHNHEI